MDHVILVNERDEEIGTGEKTRTHREGNLHRAFSIFVFDLNGRLLIQQRAGTKYHSSNLWSNTCCGHPRPGEPTEVAAHRRLREEMGFDCALQEALAFTYRAEVGNELFEHEYDHVFVGVFSAEPKPDAVEVEDWRWITIYTLTEELQFNQAQYTYWLRLNVDKLTELHAFALRDLSLIAPLMRE